MLVNGNYDERFPMETKAMPLYKLLPQPKQLSMLQGGHVPPVEEEVRVINEWLDKTLGKVMSE